MSKLSEDSIVAMMEIYQDNRDFEGQVVSNHEGAVAIYEAIEQGKIPELTTTDKLASERGLLRLVDVVWQYVKEDVSVPSTDLAQKLINKAAMTVHKREPTAVESLIAAAHALMEFNDIRCDTPAARRSSHAQAAQAMRDALANLEVKNE